ncbi:MAG: SpoIIE family protein phosphatase [Syntrophales bacterium]|jgi:sigma-B regulation protein RsbU (phosphoserine phosphatase)|nr:SpoIIE family protein phosphatase [Syntrophales bacterium]
MERGFVDLAVALIRNLSVFMLLAYFLTRIPAFGDILSRRYSWNNRVLLTILFGIFSIYGTISGIEIFGGVANFRDLGPTIAGLLAGPVVGGSAGLLGGIYRYMLGGVTALPCAVAPVMAGFAGGIVFLLKKGKDVRIWEAVLLMIVMELIHAALSLVISGARDEVLAIIRAALLPMILANGAGMAAFVFMIDNLARERRTEAAKQRIDSELRIARETQMSMVPKPRLSFPLHPGIELHAVLKPAREVGGDLYNFFPIGKDRLCLAVGDVCGKGVPASLYMAISQKLIKAAYREGESPGELLGRLNREICDGNDAMIFVTLFLAFFDARTGELEFSSAGHNPPYRIRRDAAATVGSAPALAIGIRAETSYGNCALQLGKGETLFLYTDGVTEAMNAGGELYSETGLTAALNRFRDLAPEALCREILRDIELFVGQREQSDDITVLALRFLGSPEKAGA